MYIEEDGLTDKQDDWSDELDKQDIEEDELDKESKISPYRLNEYPLCLMKDMLDNYEERILKIESDKSHAVLQQCRKIQQSNRNTMIAMVIVFVLVIGHLVTHQL